MYFFEIHSFDDEKHADNRLVQIWRGTLVIKLSFYSDFDIRFQGLFKILSLMFRQDFEVVSQMWSRSRLENNDRMPHES